MAREHGGLSRLDHAIEAALRDDSTAARDARMASVRDMSWDHRVDETLAIVGQALRERAVRHA